MLGLHEHAECQYYKNVCYVGAVAGLPKGLSFVYSARSEKAVLQSRIRSPPFKRLSAGFHGSLQLLWSPLPVISRISSSYSFSHPFSYEKSRTRCGFANDLYDRGGEGIEEEDAGKAGARQAGRGKDESARAHAEEAIGNEHGDSLADPDAHLMRE